MAIWGALISGAINIGIHALGSGGPSYGKPPKLYKLPVNQAKQTMEDYEQKRMDASIGAWKDRFPLLYQGGNFEINDIMANQQGKFSQGLKNDLSGSGLETPVETNQLAEAKQLGLNPLTLSQRTSEAVTRQIAANPEWTNQIRGGTLATLLANANQNANAFGTFLGANATARAIGGMSAGAGTTAALLSGITGSASIGARYAMNQNSPFNLGSYAQGNYYNNIASQGSPPPQAASGYAYDPYATYGNAMWNSPPAVNTTSFYGNTPTWMGSQPPPGQAYGNVDIWNDSGYGL